MVQPTIQIGGSSQAGNQNGPPTTVINPNLCPYALAFLLLVVSLAITTSQAFFNNRWIVVQEGNVEYQRGLTSDCVQRPGQKINCRPKGENTEEFLPAGGELTLAWLFAWLEVLAIIAAAGYIIYSCARRGPGTESRELFHYIVAAAGASFLLVALFTLYARFKGDSIFLAMNLADAEIALGRGFWWFLLGGGGALALSAAFYFWFCIRRQENSGHESLPMRER